MFMLPEVEVGMEVVDGENNRVLLMSDERTVLRSLRTPLRRRITLFNPARLLYLMARLPSLLVPAVVVA
jgi:hypothetical protein